MVHQLHLEDAQYESEEYERRVLRRTPQEVVYEDLETMPAGWAWARHVVRLFPPNRWHSDSVGSHRMIALDYRLSRLPKGRTQLVLTARRRPYGLGTKNPAKATWERQVTTGWKRFGKALERDYRKAGGRRART